jgi:hypothetical protein
VRSWNTETLARLLEDRGFVDVRTWTTDFSPPLGLGIWGQVRRLARAIGNGTDRGLPHLIGAGTMP